MFGIKDLSNQWIAPPIFSDDALEIVNNKVIFYESSWPERCGLYDLKSQKISIKPEAYQHIIIEDSGEIIAQDQDGIEHLLDENTLKYSFKSKYSSIFLHKSGNYRVCIRNYEENNKIGLIDHNGNEIIPPSSDIDCLTDEWIIFKKNGKKGIKDFSGKILVPPLYDKITNYTYYSLYKEPLIVVSNGEGKERQCGLVTRTGQCIVPLLYDEINWLSDHKHFILRKGRHHEMIVYQQK